MRFSDWLIQHNPFQKRVEKKTTPKAITTQIPMMGETIGGYTTATPHYAYALQVIEQVGRESDVLVAIQKALRMEIFRNGLEISESENVEEDTNSSDEEITIDVGSSDSQRKFILEKIEIANTKGESLTDVLEQIEDDYNTFDLAFLFFLFDYEIKNGEIDKKVYKETRRLDPKTVEFVINNRHEFGKDDEDNQLMVSVSDRSQVHKNRIVDQQGRKMYPAHYKQTVNGQTYYFFEWEIVHDSRYRPELLTGFSPIITVWNKVSTLMFQDFYILEYYRGKRPPKGMLLFGTANQEGLQKAWESMIARAQANPHLPPIMGVPTDPQRKGKPAEFIDFMRSLEEMQFTDVRNEFRRQIGAVFGVLPLWQGDMSQSGGLNNEGLQITVTNRAVEYAQNRYNRKFLKAFTNAIGVQGWTVSLNPSEEQDEMAKLQRQAQSLQNGQLAVQVGLEAEYDEDTGEVKIKQGLLQNNSFGVNPPPAGGESAEGVFGAPPSRPGTNSNSGEPSEEVGKSVKKNKKGFAKLAEVLKKELDDFLKLFKRFPSKKELEARIKKVRQDLQNELEGASKGLFEKLYKEEAERVEREIGINVVFGKRDEIAVKTLLSQKVLSESFEGLTDNIAQKLQETLKEAYRSKNGLNFQEIQDKIKEIAEVSDGKAEMIARTESSKISSAARRNSYLQADPEGEYKYKHIGPEDRRTTETSKRIKARTQNGVSWNEYVSIVKEESAKDFPDWTVDENFPVSHYSSRHTFVAIKP